ncbi:MAG: phytanoyl-CoA dioxygenase family protein [Sphingomonadales bacterium]|nr:phytanoyl-CoA dioxygenase family protein [Sphingomonadales bacterium]
MPNEEQIRAYERDGAVLLKQALSLDWVSRIGAALDAIAGGAGRMTSRFAGADGRGETVTDQFSSLAHPVLAEAVARSPLGGLAARAMRSDRACFVLDQMFWKAAGPNLATPYHQDTPFLHVAGDDLVRTWVCCDPSPRETTVGVVRGSHRWGVTYSTGGPSASRMRQEATDAAFSYLDSSPDARLPQLPDVQRYRDSFDVMTFAVEPGDVLLFSSNILHGSDGGIDLPHPRRAFAVLWGGPDARTLRRPGQVFPDLATMRGGGLADGSRLLDHAGVFSPVVAA